MWWPGVVVSGRECSVGGVSYVKFCVRVISWSIGIGEVQGRGGCGMRSWVLIKIPFPFCSDLFGYVYAGYAIGSKFCWYPFRWNTRQG